MATFREVILLGIILQFGPLFSVAKEAHFNENYNGTVSAVSDMIYTFQHNMSMNEAVRIHFISPDAVPTFPILIVVKRPRSVLSWTVPYIASNNVEYNYVSHTLCPDSYSVNGSISTETITVVISTSSTSNVSYSLLASFVEDFNLGINESVTFQTDPATPQYYQYQFPEGVNMVLVKALSENKTCAYLSVQNADCPVYDDVSTVRYNDGAFQTMTTQAAITVERDMFKSGSFVIVVVVHPEDKMCTDNKSIMPVNARSYGQTSARTKTVTINVERTLETSGYWKPIVTTFGVILFIYVLTGLILTGEYVRQRKHCDRLGSIQGNVRVGVCSSAEERNTSGFVMELRQRFVEESPVVDSIDFIQLPYNKLDDFSIEAEMMRAETDVLILCHSLHNRRLSLTNVTDAFYDKFMPRVSRKVGKEFFIVIAHDFDWSSDDDHLRSSQEESLKIKQPDTYKHAGTVLFAGEMQEVGRIGIRDQDWETMREVFKRCKAEKTGNGLEDVEQEERQNQVPFLEQPQGAASNYGTAGNQSSPVRRLEPPQEDGKISVDSEYDIDMLDDIESTKEVYRTKTDLCVSDLSRKKPGSLEKKYNMYAWNLFTVSVFYALPVVQLVITYQVVTNVTGNQDSCYYNFLCAKPYGWFSAFNNVFSNTGYVFLGILFVLIVWRRDHIHQKKAKCGHISETTHGIPKHYGLLYALGYALVMEGIMSGCYHVCPNRANYQFDTAYMYMIACLGMLKMYQQRHPDINANSYTSFALIALILFIGFLGLIFSSPYFYAVFFVVHMLTCFVLSAQIYNMGTVKLDVGVFKRFRGVFRQFISDMFSCTKPTHPARLALLIVGCIVNLALSILGLVTQPLDFASFLLAIMIVNMMMYLAFYFLMKLICREKILVVVIIFITLTILVWAAALYFFELHITAWQYSAARSREYNAHCYIMGFFDSHDIWHFLSAFALFVSFVSVLLLDDDLEEQPRTKIRVF